jgi:hypothetical protein
MKNAVGHSIRHLAAIGSIAQTIRPFSFASPAFTGFAFFVGVAPKPEDNLSHGYYIVNSADVY